MSYEPMLIISRSDLHAMEDVIYSFRDKKIPKKPTAKFYQTANAYKALEEALLQPKGVKISGVELAIITPQLTSHNAAVRKLLSDMEIEFTTFY